MGPLLTNGIDPVLPHGLDKRGDPRDSLPRRKRLAAPEKSAEEDEKTVYEENKLESDLDAAEHKLDDLA
jgi:hypothetical protein